MHAAAFLSHWLPGGGCGLQLWSQSTMLHSSLLLPVALAAAGRGAALRRRVAQGAGALPSHSSPFRFEPSELLQCQSQSRMPFPQLSLLLRSCDGGDCLLIAVPPFGMDVVTVLSATLFLRQPTASASTTRPRIMPKATRKLS